MANMKRLVEQFNDSLNDELVIICGVSYYKSDILYELNPFEYNEKLASYIDYYESME